MIRNTQMIIVPGLGDDVNLVTLVTKDWWQKYGLKVIIWPMPWKENGENFETKLNRLTKVIEKYAKDFRVTLLGISAGGSGVINAFARNKKNIEKVVIVSGKLKKKPVNTSSSFIESVGQCEENIKNLTIMDKQKIMTIRPIWDETVPVDQAKIEGAKNVRILSIGHVLSISLAMTRYQKKIVDFVLK